MRGSLSLDDNTRAIIIKPDTCELYVYIISPSDEYDCVFNDSVFVLAIYLYYITRKETKK